MGIGGEAMVRKTLNGNVTITSPQCNTSFIETNLALAAFENIHEELTEKY